MDALIKKKIWTDKKKNGWIKKNIKLIIKWIYVKKNYIKQFNTKCLIKMK